MPRKYAGAIAKKPRTKHYLGNINVKRDGVVEEFTEHQLSEYIKCSNDPCYFARNYVKIISLDEGLVPFDLYPYQERMYKQFNTHRFNIILAARQSGKTIGVVAYLLWYALFHSEKTVAILANKGSTAREILSRITLALENIPFFLQPGCKSLNKGSIEFSNNTHILAASTSSSSIRGFSVNLLYLDEFAFVDHDAEFYTSTYPVITAGKTTQVIITSTANGVGNTFHRLWTGAENKTNSYKSFRIDWNDVPGRDQEWKRETIANTSELQFAQEYENKFLGTGDTLIDGEHLLTMLAQEPLDALSAGSSGELLVYEIPKERHRYILTCDVCKGRGQDFSAFSIIDVSSTPFKQVATYRNRKISPILLADVVYKFANMYNEAYVIVEHNDQGALTGHGLYIDLEYENLHMTSPKQGNSYPGIEVNKKIKRLGCSGIKDLIETGKLTIPDSQTIIELSTFIAKNNSYEASPGNHDDTVMALVLFGYYATSPMFEREFEKDTKTMMFGEEVRKMIEKEKDLEPPELVIDAGHRDYNTFDRPIDDVDEWFGEQSRLYVEPW